MEMKESERTVIAKPVASRPCCSNFRSFSELLAGAINATPSASNTTSSSDIAVHAIRPKTVRFKPTPITSQAEVSGDAMCDNQSEKVLNSEVKSTVVYKPLAKVVSKTTVSLLATMGNFNQKSLQQIQTSTSSKSQHSHPDREALRPRIPSRSEAVQHPIEPSKRALSTPQNQEDDTRSIPSMGGSDRPSYDGYNWRKYGQKQVKGSEYPRSYYKCTHPSCPVKKKVERSLDGQIAEIVYKGEHNHSKPQPAKRGSSTAQLSERNEGSEGRLDSHNEVGLSSSSMHSYRGVKASQPYNSSLAALSDSIKNNTSNSIGLSVDVEAEEGSKGIEAEEYEPRSTKRRKRDNQSNETGISGGDATQEARVVVQNSSDPEVSGDGFRWRKYGQKVVKGNPYPRSYYRCTSLKCNVRKHVERASDDPRAFITTYEGKHNHEMPIRNPNSISSHTST